MAKFDVSWDEFTYDNKGEEVIKRHTWGQNGKNVTAPYSAIVNLPANARNIHVKAQGATGLFWEKWRTSIDRTFPLVNKRTISISGTTLNQKASVNPN